MHWHIVFQRQRAGNNNRDVTQLFAKTREEAIAEAYRTFKVVRIISCEPAHK